jgi:hypothetical protein
VLYQRRSASNTITHDQSNTLLIGLGIVLTPPRSGQPPGADRSTASIEATMPFFVPAAASIAYAVLQYRRLNTDKIISQGITYTILLAALILGYFLLVLGVSLMTREALETWASNPLLIALTIFLMSMLFMPVRVRLQERIDRIYFRERRDYQEKTEQFTRKLTTLTGYDQIIGEFRTLLTARLFHQHVCLPPQQADQRVCRLWQARAGNRRALCAVQRRRHAPEDGRPGHLPGARASLADGTARRSRPTEHPQGDIHRRNLQQQRVDRLYRHRCATLRYRSLHI